MDGVVLRRPTRISVRSRALPWVLLLAAGVGPAGAARADPDDVDTARATVVVRPSVTTEDKRAVDRQNDLAHRLRAANRLVREDPLLAVSELEQITLDAFALADSLEHAEGRDTLLIGAVRRIGEDARFNIRSAYHEVSYAEYRALRSELDHANRVYRLGEVHIAEEAYARARFRARESLRLLHEYARDDTALARGLDELNRTATRNLHIILRNRIIGVYNDLKTRLDVANAMLEQGGTFSACGTYTQILAEADSLIARVDALQVAAIELPGSMSPEDVTKLTRQRLAVEGLRDICLDNQRVARPYLFEHLSTMMREAGRDEDAARALSRLRRITRCADSLLALPDLDADLRANFELLTDAARQLEELKMRDAADLNATPRDR